MRYLFVFTVLLLFSCGSGEEVQEVNIAIQDSVTFKTVVKDSVVKSEIDLNSPLEEKIYLFIANFSDGYDTIANEKSILPDRFESSFSRLVALKKKSAVRYGEAENVFPIAYLSFYSYTDTIAYQNVRSNWFGCFGNDCTPIIEGEDLKSIKTTPSFTIFNPVRKEILHLYYQCEHEENNWDEFILQFRKDFAEHQAQLISVSCGGPLKWKRQ